ncbi:hypothetical protein ACX8XN_06090 [Calditrichota bacterium GD2]
MSNAKKFLIIVFTIMLVLSLQFRTSINHNMNQGFSLSDLIENIFMPEVYASTDTGCPYQRAAICHDTTIGPFCFGVMDNTYRCDKD